MKEIVTILYNNRRMLAVAALDMVLLAVLTVCYSLMPQNILLFYAILVPVVISAADLMNQLIQKI